MLETARQIKYRLKIYRKVNWIKTLYFNFKVFPFSTARKMPVFFYGKVRFGGLSGKVIIDAPVITGMIGFGQHFEQPSTYKGVAELTIKGTCVFKGRTQFGKDFFLYVTENGYCEFGNMTCLASDVKVVATEKVVLGEWTGVGYETQIIDTNSHPMKNAITGELYKMSAAIVLGAHNTLSNRISIMPGTITPDQCVIASNSLCNKDYTSLGENILIGGVPAKLLKTDYIRDWENEKPLLISYRVPF